MTAEVHREFEQSRPLLQADVHDYVAETVVSKIFDTTWQGVSQKQIDRTVKAPQSIQDALW